MRVTCKPRKAAFILFAYLPAALLTACQILTDLPALAHAAPPHPLDPLKTGEYLAVIATLEREGRVDSASRYALITLREPPKSAVLNWMPPDSVSRHAFVIVKNGRQTFEAVVDINTRKTTAWKEIKGVQPGILLNEEWSAVQQIVQADQNWQASIHKRGIHNFEDVVCVPHTIGYHGNTQENGRRLINVTCFDSRETSNYWAHPIEGVITLVDLDKREVVRITDTGTVPVPRAPAGLDEGSVKGGLRDPPHAISIVQPQGPSFKVNGHVVTWQKWQFHFRIDPRLGPVVSLVRYNDDGRLRSILYQGSLSELFVPYMDPSAGWYFKTYMDVGEYGIGKLVAPLEPTNDCPAHAVFFNVIFADDHGHPYARTRPSRRSASAVRRRARRTRH